MSSSREASTSQSNLNVKRRITGNTITDNKHSARGFASRQYTSVACVRCRHKRVRCDGTAPCSRCSQNQLDCAYEQDGRKSNTPQRQIEMLKEEIDRLRVLLSSNGISHGGTKAEAESEPAGSDESIGTVASSSKFVVDVETGEVAYYGASSHQPIFAESFQNSSSSRLPPRSQSPTRASILGGSVVTFGTLSSEVRKELLALFFTHYNDYLTFIDPVEMIDNYDAFQGSSNYSHFLLLSMLACASHLSDNPELRSDPRDVSTAGIGFVYEALDLLPWEFRHPRPSTAIALNLLAGALADMGKESLCWIYAGISVRVVQHLGLHTSSTSGPSPQNLIRQRALWSTFVHEMLASLYTGRFPMLKEEDLAVPLPVIQSTKSTASAEGYSNHAAAGARLAAIGGRVMRTMYNPKVLAQSVSVDAVLSIASALDAWNHNLKTHLFTDTAGILALRTIHLCIRLLLFRPLWTRTDFKKKPKDECTGAAIDMANLIAEWDKVYSLRRAPVTLVHNVYTATTTLLLLYVDDESTRRSEVAAALQTCAEGLKVIGQAWKLAQQALSSVGYLARTCHISTEQHQGSVSRTQIEGKEDVTVLLQYIEALAATNTATTAQPVSLHGYAASASGHDGSAWNASDTLDLESLLNNQDLLFFGLPGM